MSKRKNVSSEEAIADILKFVDHDDSSDESDLEELYGEEYVDMNVEQDKSEYDSEIDVEVIVEQQAQKSRLHKRKKLTYQRLVQY